MRGTLTGFWGKLQQGIHHDVEEWHPLEDHCADVAACANRLLNLGTVRRPLARLAGLVDLTPGQCARLGFLAALHDLGKFNHGFQRKSDPAAKDRAGHVSEFLAFFSAAYDERLRMQEVVPLEEMTGWGERPETCMQLLVASICHHGRPVAIGETLKPSLWKQENGRDPFAGMKSLVEKARTWFPDAFGANVAPLPAAPEFQHGFCGLVTLADWLGSDRKAFPFRADDDVADRYLRSIEVAQTLLNQVGLDVSVARSRAGPRERLFEDLFPGRRPRGLQSAVFELPLSPKGSLTLLEAETGAGKTEAALSWFWRLFQDSQVDGMYFALPTRTAATQLHARVLAAVRSMFIDEESRPAVVLAVPGYLQVDEGHGHRLPGFKVLWNDSESERWRFRGWAAENPKRYLAGAIVVGTIDQALLSTLEVGHSHLRAFSLGRNLLVVDEVHASDTYMTRLLTSVLARHRAMQGHALLLSATLGSTAKEQLFSQALTEKVSLEQAHAVPYPLFTHRTAWAAPDHRVAGVSPTSKHVRVELKPWSAHPSAVVAEALSCARRGARVVILRNTVRDCLETQKALEQLECGGLAFSFAGLRVPHHARYTRADRMALDGQLETHLGETARKGGCVLVATQTIQQSLDLDADILFTDLCPMDVLLQRVGRLHRHTRARPEGFEVPQLVTLTPDDRSLTVAPRPSPS